VSTVAARPSLTPAGVARLLAGAGTTPTFERHLALYGDLDRPADLIGLLAAARLRGRGGAGFPTARKLKAVAERRGRPVVVANGAEGEPVSKKDHALLTTAPHLVLDGVSLAADALGARTAVIAVSRNAPELLAAVGERERHRVDRVELEVRVVPPGFVTGEETALIRALAGRPARPTTKPPYPFERGLRGAPTLVQNVETLAHVALIARFGARWYGRGTTLVTLSGAVRQPGVHEVPVGATLGEVIERCGGRVDPVSAYLVGGYFGRFAAAAAAARLVLDPGVLGAGAIVALPAATCPVAECARVVSYLAEESAGQCGPCVHGLAAMADAFAGASHGDAKRELTRLGKLVLGRGACRHPDGAARLVESALEVFANDFARHARGRGCNRRCEGVLAVPRSAR
jgi:NADH:ubiquinone oxidoreductase subunit F (NADH-binding)